MSRDAESPADIARRLMRSIDRASLATIGRSDGPAPGAPYASLVLVATDHDARPLLLVSGLADHTRNLLADSRASLLFEDTGGLAQPLAGQRVTVVGRAAPSDVPRHRARFLARHPSAATYADFADFRVWRIEPAQVHLVAGFGRIDWLAAAEVLFDDRKAASLCAHEQEIVAHMNAGHADAIALYATKLLDRSPGDWRMIAIDPEGADLRSPGETARLAFARPVLDPKAAREELARLAGLARQRV